VNNFFDEKRGINLEFRESLSGEPTLCFTERSDERDYAGLFAIVNQYLFAEAYSLETYGTFLGKVESPTLERLFSLNADLQGDVQSRLDVRDVIHSSGIEDDQNAHAPAKISDLKKRKHILDARLKIRDKPLHKLYTEGCFSNFTLGIHLRGTDKSREIAGPSHKLILNTIKSVLQEHPITDIFLATDDSEFVGLIKRHFGHLDLRLGSLGDNVGRKPVHLKPGGVKNLHSVDFGALRDAVDLSKCQILIYSYSNLSRFALFLGAERFVRIVPLASDQSTLRARLIKGRASAKEYASGAAYKILQRLQFKK
jgi:hypothetical protein